MTESVSMAGLSTRHGIGRNITSILGLVPALVLIRGLRLRNPRELPGATLKPEQILAPFPGEECGFGGGAA